MADDFNKLALLIESNTKSYENAMKKIEARTNAALGKIEGRAKKSERAFSGLAASAEKAGAMIGRMGTALLAGLSVRQAIGFADAFTRIENGLRVAGLEGENLRQVYDRLFQSAQKNAAPLEALATVYSRTAQVQKELGISQEQLLRFADTLAVGLRVSGRSAEEAKGALLQLSQALATGTVRAEEYNSINEGLPIILVAAANGLKDAGGSVAQLRKIMLAGHLSSRAFFDAIEAGSQMLRDKAATASLTTGQAMQQLQNSLITAAGGFDKATGATEGFATAVGGIATWIDGIGESIDRNTPAIESFIQLLKNAAKTASLSTFFDAGTSAVGAQLSRIMGTEDADVKLRRQLLAAETTAQAMRGMGQDASEAEAMVEALNQQLYLLGSAGRPGRLGVAGIPVAPTVSLADYASPDGKDKGGKKSKVADPWKDFGFSDEALDTTSDFTDMMSELEAQTNRNRDAFKSLASGIVSDLRQGKSAVDALGNALDSIIDKLLDQALNSLIAGLFPATAGADPWAGMRTVTTPGRALGGPVSANKPYMVGERGPEMFIPSTAGKVAANTNSAPIINITTPPGTSASTSTRRGSGGASITDIVVSEVNRAIGSGKMDKAMGGRFGAQPQARSR